MRILSAEFAGAAVDPSGFPRDGLPQVAVAGRSNVGKSSLLNFLLGRRGLVKASAAPGKTRQLNFFRVNDAFYFVDVPGFGYARAGHGEKRAMETALTAYFSACRDLAGVLYLLDIRHPDSAVDGEALEWLAGFGHPLLPVATKADKVGKAETEKSLRAMAARHGWPSPPLATSVQARRGRDEVWAEVVGLLARGSREAQAAGIEPSPGP